MTTNTGNHNTGNHNTGNCNTGSCNTGYRNTGIYNTGDLNTGIYNTGDLNTGDCNTGYRNTGNHNTGNRNTGWFNTITPEAGYYFNRWLSHAEWDKALKPEWIFLPKPTTWVPTEDMTREEKIKNLNHKTTGGYLRVNNMREEWRKAFESATEEEIQMVRDLPNFDAEVFKEITGLDLSDNSCDGKVVEIDGKKYQLKAL